MIRSNSGQNTMKPIDEQHQRTNRTSQDMEWPPTLTIDHLPDEVLLEIFDSYRQDIDPYDQQWRKKHAWIGLTHVCGKWRAVIFASSSRLDLGITVGPKKPSHIKTILSGPLPIFIDYKYVAKDFGSALWRMRAALKHRDRVREISFEGISPRFDEFFKVTQCTFPVLESLFLRFGNHYQPTLPDTFLGGPDLLYLHLRRLKLERTTLASISRFLSSATALTDLILQIDTAFNPSAETSLLACLQGMPCLGSLCLTLTHKSPSQPPTPYNIVPLSKLSYLHYVGHGVCLDALVAGLSAPSLRDASFKFYEFYHATIWPPLMHFPRFINEIKESRHAAHVEFNQYCFHLSLLTHSEHVGQCKPRFKFGPIPSYHSDFIIQISGALSTKLITIRELRVTFDRTFTSDWDYFFFPWHRFLLQFPSVKVLRTEGTAKDNHCIGRAFLQDLEEPDGFLVFLPSLEEIELGKDESRAHESQTRSELAAFQPFVSARQQAGRPVKIFYSS